METDPFQLDAGALAAARRRIAPHVPPTTARRWPLLEEATGTPTWTKHENHNPTGAFKERGGVNLVGRMVEEAGGADRLPGLVSATRGDHGQSLAFAGRLYGVPTTIVVPHGNSPDKDAAVAGYGAELVVHGDDFQVAREHAGALAEERGLTVVPPFHPWLVEGVASYVAELHEAVPDLDVVYVPVGMGSGIAAQIAVRDLLGRATEVVGMVSERAPAYALSFAAGEPVSTPAGALAVAGLLAERERVAGRRVAVVHTGGTADFDVLARVMGGSAA